MNKVSILIADDHKLLRETLSYIIDSDPGLEVIAVCGDSQEAIEIAKIKKPDIVLMDINIAPFSGIEATQKIKQSSPASIVIGMSMHSDPVYAKKMLKMGARGYVTKNSSKDEILTAIMKVRQGEVYICKEIKDILAERLCGNSSSAPELSSLTKREMQIVHLVKEGHSSKEIAADINITKKTVEVHRHNILKKLKLTNAASMVNFVYANGGLV